MISFFIIAIKIIVLLGFLIFIHELGHFTVAKLCKVKVNEFAIGFGPTIWKKQGKETKYAIRLIPLGGFVSMEGEEEQSENEGSFSKASIPKRIAIVLAGAIVNIVFAVCLYFGLTSTAGTFVSNEIDSTIEGYSAQTAGLEAGDKIIEINNKKIGSKYDLDKIMSKQKGETIDLKVERNGNIEEYKIKPTEIKNKITGIYLDNTCKIISVDKESSAEKQGIKANDKLVKINGETVEENREKAIEILQKNKEKEKIQMTLQRGNAEIIIDLVPETVSTYYLGVNMKMAEDTFINRCINGGISN